MLCTRMLSRRTVLAFAMRLYENRDSHWPHEQLSDVLHSISEYCTKSFLSCLPFGMFKEGGSFLVVCHLECLRKARGESPKRSFRFELLKKARGEGEFLNCFLFGLFKEGQGGAPPIEFPC